jgi:dUTP pyrophosphatase
MINIFCDQTLLKVLKDNDVKDYCPAYNGESVGLDLYNAGDEITIPSIIESKSIPRTLIPTGLFIDVPLGYVALIQERGSITKTSLKVRAGVIDPGYTGEIFVNLVNLSNESKKINQGSKLPVQIVVVKCDNKFKVIEEEEYLRLTNEKLRKCGKVGSSD